MSNESTPDYSTHILLSIPCLTCVNIDVDETTSKLHADNEEPYFSETFIFCKHAGICKYYDSNQTIHDILIKTQKEMNNDIS